MTTIKKETKDVEKEFIGKWKMSKQWNLEDIGKEAKLLDEKNIKERMKIECRSIKKIFVALLIYIAVMTLFVVFL